MPDIPHPSKAKAAALLAEIASCRASLDRAITREEKAALMPPLVKAQAKAVVLLAEICGLDPKP